MAEQQEAVTRRYQDDQVAVVESDVPVGWSLDDWREARALARELTEPAGGLRMILSKLRGDARIPRSGGGGARGSGGHPNRVRER